MLRLLQGISMVRTIRAEHSGSYVPETEKHKTTSNLENSEIQRRYGLVNRCKMLAKNIWRLLLTACAVVIASLYLSYKAIFDSDKEPAPLEDYKRPWNEPSATLPSETNNTKLPLSTLGRYIIDADGQRVRLFSVNWYGASDEGFAVGGLEHQHRDDIAKTIKSLGFNSVRLPYSDELVYKNPEVFPELLTANQDLWGLSALEVYAAIVDALTSAGLYVIINNHITKSRWCCDGNLCDAKWKNDYLGPFCPVRQNEESWIRNWEIIMQPHANNPFVIGVDLRNEPRGPTDKFLWPSWAEAAENAARRLHAVQPNWLVFVEGISSANDVSGAQTRPVELSVPHKLVYSAHVYGWSGWGSLSPFWRRSYESFAAEMEHNWAWLLHENVAPVWIGEIGAPDVPNRGDLHYWNNLMNYLRELDRQYDKSAHLAYWAINPRKWKNNEYESYGLLDDDWITVRKDYRLMELLDLVGTK